MERLFSCLILLWNKQCRKDKPLLHCCHSFFWKSAYICSSPGIKIMVFFPLGLFLGHSITPLPVLPVSFQLLKTSPISEMAIKVWLASKRLNQACVKELSPPYNLFFEEQEGLLSKLLLPRTGLSRLEVRSHGDKLTRRQLCEHKPGWLQTPNHSMFCHGKGLVPGRGKYMEDK